MELDSLYQWILSIVGGGGLGAAITYLFTLKSKVKTEDANAVIVQTKAEHEKLDLKQDKYEYLQETLDKYIRDYHDLEDNFRTKMREVRETIDVLTRENSRIISEKCNEIAALKSQVTYLKGIRCYKFTCMDRVKNNPDKSEQ